MFCNLFVRDYNRIFINKILLNLNLLILYFYEKLNVYLIVNLSELPACEGRSI